MNHGYLAIALKPDPAIEAVESPLMDHAFLIGDLCGQLATTGGASLDQARQALQAVKRKRLFVDGVKVIR